MLRIWLCKFILTHILKTIRSYEKGPCSGIHISEAVKASTSNVLCKSALEDLLISIKGVRIIFHWRNEWCYRIVVARKAIRDILHERIIRIGQNQQLYVYPGVILWILRIHPRPAPTCQRTLPGPATHLTPCLFPRELSRRVRHSGFSLTSQGGHRRPALFLLWFSFFLFYQLTN